MKKLVSLLFILSPCYCLAQFEKLTLYTGGSGSYISERRTLFINDTLSNTSSRLGTLFLNSKIGFFPVDRLLVGPSLTWTLLTSNSDSNGYGYISSTITAGPFIRYYVFRGLFVQADYTWGVHKSKSNSDSGVSRSKSTSKSFTAGVGYSVLLNQSKSVALDISMVYQNASEKYLPDVVIEGSGFIVTVGVSGFLHLLNKK